MVDKRPCCHLLYTLGTLCQLGAWLAGSDPSGPDARSDQPGLDLFLCLTRRILRPQAEKIGLPSYFWRLNELSCHLCARFRGTFCRRHARILAHRYSRNDHGTIFLPRIRPQSAQKAQYFLISGERPLELRRLARF